MIEEGSTDTAQELAGSLVLVQAGGYATLDPTQPEAVQRAPVRCSQLPPGFGAS